MSEIPAELKYTREHEWVRREPDGSLVVGITDHAQEELGELVYVELPELERTFAAGDALVVVESTKAASDVYAPAGGVIVAVNDALNSHPGLANSDPYGEGWLVRLQPDGAGESDELLDAGAYAALLEGDGG